MDLFALEDHIFHRLPCPPCHTFWNRACFRRRSWFQLLMEKRGVDRRSSASARGRDRENPSHQRFRARGREPDDAVGHALVDEPLTPLIDRRLRHL